MVDWWKLCGKNTFIMLNKFFLRFLILIIVAPVLSCSSSQKKVMETSTDVAPEQIVEVVETPITPIPKEKKTKPSAKWSKK